MTGKLLTELLVTLALILKVTGIAAITSGIVVELKRKAGWGYVAITVGSLLVAIGALIWAKVIPATVISAW